MITQDMPREQLARELENLRRRVAELEKSEAGLLREQRLRRDSETRFRILYENAPLGYQSLDRDGLLLAVNQAWLDILGYSREEIAGKSFVDFLTPGSQDHFKTSFPDFKAAGEIRRAEFEMIRKDGSQITAFLDGKSIYDEQSRLSEICCIVQDVTTIKQSMKAIKESEYIYRSIVTNIEVGISLINSNMEIVRVNKSVQINFPNVRPSEGQICYNQYNDPPGTEPCSYCPCVLTLQDGKTHEAVTETPAGAEIRNYRIISSPIKDSDGRVQYVIELTEDITELKRTQEALDRANLEWERTFNAISDPIMVLDTEHKMIRANRAMAAAFEKTEQELKGKECFGVVHGGERPHPFCPHSQLLVDGQEHSAEIAEPRLGGIYEVRVSPLVGHDGQVAGSVHVARDITARKQSEEALRKSEEKYKTRFEESFDGLFITSPQGRILDMNRKGVAMFGYDTKAEVLNLDLERDVYAYPPDRQRILSMVNTRGSAEYEVVVKKKSGEHMVTFCSLTAVRDKGGAITSYRGIIRDITERKRAEEALLAASRYNRSLIEASLDPLVTISTEGKITDVNAATEQVTGYSRDELIGTDFSHYFAKPERARSGCERAFKDGSVKNYELEIRHRDGRLTPVVYNASVFRDGSGRIVGLFAAARDISLRQQAEEKNLWLASIVESSDDAIIGKSLDGVITSWNKGAEKIYGYKEDEAIGEMISLVVPPDRRHEVARFLERIGYGEHTEHYETVRRRKDGREIDVSLTISPIRNTTGHIIGASTIARDISQQKSLQRQLLQAQKIEAIGTLAGGIAHDFNNILGIIMGYAEIARFDLDEGSPGKQSIDEVLKATQRAKDLVAQILTFSRRTEQELSPLHIVPLVKESLKFLRASLPASVEIRQELLLPEGKDLVLTDPTQIHQVLMNLATNAAHAMRVEGGVLQVTLSAVHFDLLDAGKPLELDAGEYLLVSVQDTGHGMDRATMDRIFDPYFTTKRPGEGTGLGLAVVHGIAKSCGGTITVHSEPGKGAVFHVYLPRAESSESSEVQATTHIHGGNKRILLVDDEEALTKAIKKMIERLGYKVTDTTSSIEALSLFRQRPEEFDLVITDYSMPKMTGVDLAVEIMQIRPDIPVILSTGFNEKISEKSVKNVGISALIMKPISLSDIAEIIHEVLKTNGD